MLTAIVIDIASIIIAYLIDFDFAIIVSYFEIIVDIVAVDLSISLSYGYYSIYLGCLSFDRCSYLGCCR